MANQDHLSSWSKYSQVMLAGNQTSSSQMAATISSSNPTNPHIKDVCIKHCTVVYAPRWFGETVSLQGQQRYGAYLPQLAYLSPLHWMLLQLLMFQALVLARRKFFGRNSLILSSYIYLQNNAIWEGGSTARSYPQIGLLYYHILENTCSKSTSGAMLIITMTSPPRFAVCPQNFANWFGSSHCLDMLYTFLQIKFSC